MTTTTLQQLQAKIREACPDVDFRLWDSDRHQYIGWNSTMLHHVLRAVGREYYVRQDGTFFKWERFTEGGDGHHGVESTWVTWNLTKPLEGQEESVILFLHGILCP